MYVCVWSFHIMPHVRQELIFLIKCSRQIRVLNQTGLVFLKRISESEADLGSVPSVKRNKRGFVLNQVYTSRYKDSHVFSF